MALWAHCAMRVAGDRRPFVSALLLASVHPPEGDEHVEHEMGSDKEYV